MAAFDNPHHQRGGDGLGVRGFAKIAACLYPSVYVENIAPIVDYVPGAYPVFTLWAHRIVGWVMFCQCVVRFWLR